MPLPPENLPRSRGAGPFFMSISKKVRFEIFKRDGFACGYCGKTPPNTILEIDHIDPRSKGGSNESNNLLTSCFDCNRGKRNIPLTKIPNSLSQNLEIIKERETQLRQYNNFLSRIKARENKQIDEISEMYCVRYKKWRLSDSFKQSSLRMFLRKLPFEIVKEAMQMSCGRISDSDHAIKYFCGICWRSIKGESHG